MILSRAVTLLLVMTGTAAATVTAVRGPDHSVRLESEAARFDVLPDGSILPFARQGLQWQTVVAKPPAAANKAGSRDIRIEPVSGASGQSGQRVRLSYMDRSNSRMERTQTFELYEKDPDTLLITVTCKNLSSHPAAIDSVTMQSYAVNPSAWAFQGASRKWGEDFIQPLQPGSHQVNKVGESLADGNGGGIPVLVFWDKDSGVAIGHLETKPVTMDMPVDVPAAGPATAALRVAANVTLQPGQSYTSPVTFVTAFHGDFYEALRNYARMLRNRGWTSLAPSKEAYKASWCGWGYQSDVTAEQMLGVIPKLKEYHIEWATLDDRWFDTYGDWNPRADLFSGTALQEMVAAYHRNGIRVQLWWLPLAAEIPGAKYEDHTYSQSIVARDHPDWLILDKRGKPALMTRQLGTLCPAVPEVQAYFRELTTKFIRDWDFDGNKLDNVFSVPACYNPQHHHHSPYDSVNAMGDVYKIIYETTRHLKPESITQSCPCGTTPNMAWLPYMDQPVTADPVNSRQVRLRIKMYKALLGPRAPVYGDHVELTKLVLQDGHEYDIGRDFASTVGTGGVVGTKFVWPQKEARFDDVILTGEKDQLWKKWLDIYRTKMLSSGEFLNLYRTGYDSPEGYAIAKDGKLYYGFYSPGDAKTFEATVELRGLEKGIYRAFDYVHQRDLGVVTSEKNHLQVRFEESLLLEVSPLLEEKDH